MQLSPSIAGQRTGSLHRNDDVSYRIMTSRVGSYERDFVCAVGERYGFHRLRGGIYAVSVTATQARPDVVCRNGSGIGVARSYLARHDEDETVSSPPMMPIDDPPHPPTHAVAPRDPQVPLRSTLVGAVLRLVALAPPPLKKHGSAHLTTSIVEEPFGAGKKAMSRPLYRGFSGGGRGSGGAGHDFFDVCCQAKDLGENGFGHELMSPAGTNRSRQSLIFTFLKLGLVVFIVLSLSTSLYWAISISTSSRGNIHHGYRRLQEQVVADLTEIGELSLGIARLKELEFCPPEYENYAPCYNNVSEDFDLVDPLLAIEYERNCVPDFKKGCLILPPRNYRIPLRWPGGRDIIWKENVKITGQEFSSGSLTKR
ncbi:hypothetical protein B296_00027383 [Ensete ventricosum]|uniref:Methyltransferase n=1 Tax=Ensete ventricosum TaxID=4639 RepID=A0A426ZU68_ENSVE|nr:hypothetical protein B296_00027383 [Ensete ventricosum]